MTTIAYKDGIIAYDSRAVRGGTITNDDFNKHQIVKDTHFFICGAVSDHKQLIDAYFGGENIPKSDATALVVSNGELYFIGIEENGFWKQPLEQYEIYSEGSGSDHAFTAMDLGCSAKEAVKIAIKRDSGSGGKVRTFKIR